MYRDTRYKTPAYVNNARLLSTPVSGNKYVNIMDATNSFLIYIYPPDSKREEFRKYLERAGVMDALTKVLVSLYEEPEKPDDALEYIRLNLGGITEVDVEVQTLKKELEEAKAKINELKTKLVKYEADEGTD
ncbi:c-Myc-binding protein isoform X1 [Apis florea]|uniref:c-Myc-binding protein isoform X1 n=1 Tax=Apis florea TaxID=7463 RepID=UPI00062996DA|nr:c-Myc-binding protein isoform X1 [Apis florea]